MDAATTKQALRRALRVSLRDVDLTARVAAGLAITHHLSAWVGWHQARWIAAFVGERHEPSTDVLLLQAIDDGKEVWLPSARPGELLTFRRCVALADLRPGPMGPLEVEDAAPPQSLLSLAQLRGGLVLVPALALSSAGARIGRGGGYYDAALADLHAGLAPTERNDRALVSISERSAGVEVVAAGASTGEAPRTYVVGIALARFVDPMEGVVPEDERDQRVDYVCDERGLRRCIAPR